MLAEDIEIDMGYSANEACTTLVYLNEKYYDYHPFVSYMTKGKRTYRITVEEITDV